MVLELKLELSEAIAQEAKSKGLLESPTVERMLGTEMNYPAASGRGIVFFERLFARGKPRGIKPTPWD